MEPRASRHPPPGEGPAALKGLRGGVLKRSELICTHHLQGGLSAAPETPWQCHPGRSSKAQPHTTSGKRERNQLPPGQVAPADTFADRAKKTMGRIPMARSSTPAALFRELQPGQRPDPLTKVISEFNHPFVGRTRYPALPSPMPAIMCQSTAANLGKGGVHQS